MTRVSEVWDHWVNGSEARKDKGTSIHCEYVAYGMMRAPTA